MSDTPSRSRIALTLFVAILAVSDGFDLHPPGATRGAFAGDRCDPA
jgi:hypothetical protein